MQIHIKPLILTLAFAAAAACQPGFEEINTDRQRPTEKEMQMDGLNVGGLLTSLEQTIFPVGNSGTNYVNDYQIPYTLAGACWVGYMAPTSNKWWDRGFPTFWLKNWSQYTYNVMAGNTYRSLLQVRNAIGDDPTGIALTNIIKVAAVHKAADTFGPIPYSNALNPGALTVSYDALEEIYPMMLDELDKAVAQLDKAGHNIYPNYDVIYEGDYRKWIRLANSLMLRLAMRTVYADEALARKYAEKALTNPIGVMTSKDDMATLSKGAGITYKNPLTIINGAYNDSRMGAEIYTYLTGYKDARIGAYFNRGNISGTEGYYAVRCNLPSQLNYYLNSSATSTYSTLNVSDDTPVYIMKASEVYFLRAEGALRGWNMGGTAQSLYNEGIAMSFSENGLTVSDSYLSDAASVPADYVDGAGIYSTPATSTITIMWNNSAEFETSLERIITQKYLALYPDGQEAWSEYRRTGYPRRLPVQAYNTDSNVNPAYGPTRIPYSNDEYQKNLENIRSAVSKLRGDDNGATRLWWDKKEK